MSCPLLPFISIDYLFITSLKVYMLLVFFLIIIIIIIIIIILRSYSTVSIALNYFLAM